MQTTLEAIGAIIILIATVSLNVMHFCLVLFFSCLRAMMKA